MLKRVVCNLFQLYFIRIYDRIIEGMRKELTKYQNSNKLFSEVILRSIALSSVVRKDIGSKIDSVH